MKKILGMLLSMGVAAVVMAVAGPTQAEAYSGQSGWGEWLLPTGTICLETQGNAVLAGVAADWNKSDAVIVGKTKCTGFARNMTVKYVGYNRLDGNCGYTTTSAGWSWQKVRGLWTWTPNAPTVYINYALQYRAGCRGSAWAIKHVYEHEFGHVLGLAHVNEPSVVAAGSPYGWKYNAPTKLDIWRVNYRY